MNIPQSFSWWCFENRGVEPEVLLAAAKKIGYAGVDLIQEEYWPLAKAQGLTITAVNGHGTLEDGLNRPENAERIGVELQTNIAKAREWGIPVLICFSGNRNGITDDIGLQNCADLLKNAAPTAEAAGVTLAVELLNSKVDHIDYQCDHTAWGAELIRQVGSPRVKLLYDVYHMQVMEGDIIRTIRENHAAIGHYHTAGNPGRGQPDDTQEIYYPAIYRAIAATGYKGFISHEFLPAGEPIPALERAWRDCENALSLASK